jgi:putative transcriptional regulator
LGRVINTIRRHRFEAGEMTQKDLAARAGVTRQTIVALEAGSYAPSLDLAFRIARAFDKPLQDVFQYQDD